MPRVTVTVNGVSVDCDLSEVAAVTAALGGSTTPPIDDVVRPGERRRENPTDTTQQARAAEFRKIREQYTSVPVSEVAARGVPSDSRRRTPNAGDR